MLVGVQKAAINKYETGIVINLKRSTIEKLANALDTSPAYLMGFVEKNTEKTPAPISESERLYPAGYDQLNEANRAIVDRLIADLAKTQSDS